MFGLTMIESTGMLGRLPLLFAHVNVAQFEVQVTWNTWPGVNGVLASKPPTAAYPVARSRVGVDGSSAIPSTGRFGSTVLPPVTSTQFAWEATPVPRLKPIQTLASFVPTIAWLDHLGEYLTWLMNERLPSVCLVMFCVGGLFVMYHVPDMLAFPPPIVSKTLVVPSMR
jgi:hypothetical protein